MDLGRMLPPNGKLVSQALKSDLRLRKSKWLDDLTAVL